MRKLYIDLQFFQTPVWDRGMGKYTMSLLKHSAAELDKPGTVLIFSSNLPKDKAMMDEVTQTLPRAVITYLDLATTEKTSYADAARINKSVLESFVGHDQASERVFLIPCLFQEPTASVYPAAARCLMIYYDAIPFLYYQKYRNAINYENYLQRYRTLLESDVIMTISETVKNDLAIYLGIENIRRRIVSIDGAAIIEDPRSRKPSGKMTLDYILLTTSDDIRKNNTSAVLALKQLNKITKKSYKMIITSTFRRDHRRELEKLSKDLIFTGNVRPDELNWLYQNAKIVLTTSEYEGLGLPILEATHFEKPIVCSNIAVFREISSQAFYYFDPLDIEEATLMMRDALEGKEWPTKKRHYKTINEKYTWARSAKLLADEINGHPTQVTSRSQKPKPKVAILCPTPSGYSAVGRVVQETHDAIAGHFDIDYFFEDRKKDVVSIRPNYLAHITDAYDVSDFNATKYAEYDAVLFHIGNSEYHFDTIRNALYLPGIAIIHDTKLNECFGEMVRLGYLPPQRMNVEATLDKLIGTDRSAFITTIVNDQICVVVNSDYAKSAVDKINFNQVSVNRGFLALPAPRQLPSRVRHKVTHVGLGGVLSGKRKGIDIIKDLAADQKIARNVVFHVFGFNLMEPEDIDELKSYDNIILKTDLSDLAYQTQLANMDIMVNYRSEYKGESSSSVLEAMRYGCAVIVNGKEGWFAELPDDTVVKVGDPKELESILRDLILSATEREKIGRAASRYIADSHSPTVFASELEKVYDQSKAANNINAKKANALKGSRNLNQLLNELRRSDG